MNIIDAFSLTAVPIFMNSDTGRIGHGSCFFYVKNSNIYLITNWHNLAGRIPYSGQSIDSNGQIPSSISIPFHVSGEIGLFTDLKTFPLYSNDGTSLWLQHDVHGQKVDIAILKIELQENWRVYPINDAECIEDMRIDVGMNAFVLGFPIKIFTGIFPVWKRATIATEYIHNIDGFPKFLIDTATHKGMSGSPVILRESGPYVDTEGKTKISMPAATKFLGVYSGRHTSDKLDEIQLGIVWKKILIDEIIQGGIPGTYEIVQAAE